MRKLGASRGPVSVRLSVTFLYCIEMAKAIIKLLPQHGSPNILVLKANPALQNYKANPITADVKYTGVRKIRHFRPISRYIF